MKRIHAAGRLSGAGLPATGHCSGSMVALERHPRARRSPACPPNGRRADAQIIGLNLDIVSLNAAHTEAGAAADAAPADSALAANRELLRQVPASDPPFLRGSPEVPVSW
jgi:hypothetical protein